MKQNYYVYGLFRPDNGHIFYIGMGQGNRAWQHVRDRKPGKSYKDNIICKMIDTLGYADIPIVMIAESLTREEAIELEILLIQYIGRHPNGPLANIVRGGEGLADPTQEFRQRHGTLMRAALGAPEIKSKMSASAKARIRTPESEAIRLAAAATPEAQAKRTAARRGKPSGRKGKKYAASERMRQTQSDRQWITNGIVVTRIKITQEIPKGWWIGRLPLGEQAKENMSRARKGKPHGRRPDEASIERISQQAAKNWANPATAAKLRKSRQGLIWITDGHIDRRVPIAEEIPAGFRRGRKSTGRPAHNKGKPCPPDQRRQISKTLKGRNSSTQLQHQKATPNQLLLFPE